MNPSMLNKSDSNSILHNSVTKKMQGIIHDSDSYYYDRNFVNTHTARQNSLEQMLSPLPEANLPEQKFKSAKRKKQIRISGIKRNLANQVNRSKESLSKMDNLDSTSRIYQIYNVSNLSNISEVLKYKVGGEKEKANMRKPSKYNKPNNPLNLSMKVDKQ